MGAKQVQEFPYIKEFFAEASEVLHFDILGLCMNGSEEELNLTANAQPAILLLSYSSYQIVRRETDVLPFVMAGHSLGEISALCCSGALRLTDAVRLVRRRGELMQRAITAGQGAMLAINGLSVDDVQTLCDIGSGVSKAVISNINSRQQIVISGEKACVGAVGDRALQLGAIVIPLKVSAPFHSPLMRPAAIGLEAELQQYTFSRLDVPVMSNVTCKPYLNEHEIIPLLTRQVTTVVNWLKIMHYLGRTSVTATLELLPKKTLTKLLHSEHFSNAAYTFDQLEELQKIIHPIE